MLLKFGFEHVFSAAVDACDLAAKLRRSANSSSFSGYTALDWAIAEKNAEVEGFLRSKGVSLRC